MAFLKTSETTFTLNNQLFIPFGASLYSPSIPQSNASFDTSISQVVAANCNMVRLINFLPASATASIEYSETYWTAVDYCLSICRTNNIKVILDITDYAVILDLPHNQ